MKEVAGAIIILAGSLLLIAAMNFDSVLFWIIGGFMLVDGYFLLAASIFFPRVLKELLWKENHRENN